MAVGESALHALATIALSQFALQPSPVDQKGREKEGDIVDVDFGSGISRATGHSHDPRRKPTANIASAPVHPRQSQLSLRMISRGEFATCQSSKARCRLACRGRASLYRCNIDDREGDRHARCRRARSTEERSMFWPAFRYPGQSSKWWRRATSPTKCNLRRSNCMIVEASFLLLSSTASSANSTSIILKGWVEGSAARSFCRPFYAGVHFHELPYRSSTCRSTWVVWLTPFPVVRCSDRGRLHYAILPEVFA